MTLMNGKGEIRALKISCFYLTTQFALKYFKCCSVFEDLEATYLQSICRLEGKKSVF